MEEKAAAIGFSFSAKLGDKLDLVAQTHVDRDAPLATINATVDKVRAVLERQKAAAELAELRQKLKYDEKKLRQLGEDFVAIGERHKKAWEESGKRGEFKLGAKEAAERNNALSTIDRYELEIALDKENIAERELLLAVRRPTIAELEELLKAEPDDPVDIMPDGSVRRRAKVA